LHTIRALASTLKLTIVASIMLDFLEVRFGEQYYIPKQDIHIEMAEVVSIHNDIVKLSQLGLLDIEVNNQSWIDEILRSMIHSFKEFRCKLKGKNVCSLSKRFEQFKASSVRTS
jgi:hypothetical protein